MENDFQKLLTGIKKYRGITDDSRKVKNRYIFVAIKGLTSDGHKFIVQSRKNGAKVVVGERGSVDIKVQNARRALSLLASAFYGYPSKKMKIIGVTGTDGKTTTATLIYWILKSSGIKTGLVSTVSAKIGNKDYDTGFHTTNPEPLALQKFLSKMVKAKCEYAVLEVTSHGLDQERVYDINFDIGVLTNITHEHLDYHKTFRNYALAKQKLFENSNTVILNKKYEHLIKSKNERILYNPESLKGDLKDVVSQKFKEPYNILNATAAILTAKEIGVNDRGIIKAIKTFPGVEGRMEEIKNSKGIKIVIDFAHTPNALESVLNVLKKQVPKGNKLIAVFGCAGERDVQKRPMMAGISTRLADISVFTAEDPRNEKTSDIISQMMEGIKNKKAKVYEIEDRQEAISLVINKLAKKGDIVVICGKGHEKSMNINGVEYPWSDKEAVKFAPSKSISAIILAAGKGTRMGGKIPKVLLPINGKSIIACDLELIQDVGIRDVVVVTGYKSSLVVKKIKELGFRVKFVKQGCKTGTAGATMAGLKNIRDKSDTVLVVFGDDSALYRKNTLQRFIEYFYFQNCPFSAVAIEVKGASSLGGLDVNSNGEVVGILGHDRLVSRGDKKTIVLCGLLCFKRKWLTEKIKLIPKNAKSGEYSLPYLFKVAYLEGYAIRPFLIKNTFEWSSVNTPEEFKVAKKRGENKWKE